MIRTIFIDFGNVIAFFDHHRAINKLLPHTDRTASELLTLYGGELETAYECGRISTDEFVAKAIEIGQLRCSKDTFLEAFVDIFSANDHLHQLIPEWSQQYRLVLASNTNDAHFRHYREQFRPILDHFDHLVPSHQAKARKPQPDYFAYCQQHAQCEPSECVLIDDLPANIDAARRFGWQGIVYTPQTPLTDELRKLAGA